MGKNEFFLTCKEKSFAIVFLNFFYFSFSLVFLPTFHHSLPRKRVTRIRLISLDTLANIFLAVLFIVKFRVCEFEMPYTLEINSNGGIKLAGGIFFFNH